ncbi:MAG: thiol:disulfide interchange protein DsbA/DsbL [Gammaproteobacteria bacterium]|nr:thiol:disulfide interchange protein DsbA/DsbL [Gammaproteobacteria bacterium]MBU6509660.1 thiol:disulfide interchange protein DsbA/DsbL [Gammaproteobacteria bacterium]MDE1983990.1 thiol:disulfide interchange protein DsbA/DsbL [Gammaproteobacteria bacterium]MDE2108273.1 thiol:disulfide interchange protein DsbA/DsbL [Gammaproteobacteria bacterium]MDE2460326.1 thiol:disulfide interchange protein DsbA/DsbL [Gammaproteobacteria bacterium]
MSVTAFAADAPAPYKEGINYIPVMPAQPISVNPGQVEVLEFFWYGNPQCFALEPYLTAWQKNQPANVVLTRVPAALNPQWDVAARAYYTAVQLGVADKANALIYAAIHAQHLSLTTSSDYQRLFISQLGVSTQQFTSTWNSLQVDARLAQAKVLAQRYGVTNVPTLTVDGKWLTGVGYHLSTAQIMPEVSWLVQQDQGAMAAAAQ